MTSRDARSFITSCKYLISVRFHTSMTESTEQRRWNQLTEKLPRSNPQSWRWKSDTIFSVASIYWLCFCTDDVNDVLAQTCSVVRVSVNVWWILKSEEMLVRSLALLTFSWPCYIPAVRRLEERKPPLMRGSEPVLHVLSQARSQRCEGEVLLFGPFCSLSSHRRHFYSFIVEGSADSTEKARKII